MALSKKITLTIDGYTVKLIFLLNAILLSPLIKLYI